MQKAETVLSILKQKSKQDESHRYDRIYRNLFNEDFFLRAYQKIHAKQGNMTPGTDGTKDKTNMESAKRFHEAMKNSKLVIVEDSGHEVNKDNPRKLVSILQDFWVDN